MNNHHKDTLKVKGQFIALMFGLPALLFAAELYDVLSPREWAFGMLAWFAILLLWWGVRKHATKNQAGKDQDIDKRVPLNDKARKRTLHRLWIKKVCTSLLVASLLIGIPIGVANRAWLPMLAGAAMSLSIIYFSMKDIRRRQRLIDQPPRPDSDVA